MEIWDRVSRMIRTWMREPLLNKSDRPTAIDSSQFWREVREGELEAENRAGPMKELDPTRSAGRGEMGFVELTNETRGSDL